MSVAAGSQPLRGQEDFQGKHCPLVQKESYCQPAHTCPHLTHGGKAT